MTRKAALGLALPVLLTALAVLAAPTVPTEIEQPGTQPGEVAQFASNCDSCHLGTGDPTSDPSHLWYGSMMSNAGHDPIFWATLAIAEQDFIPNADPTQRGGAGDLCLRCHTNNGWIGQRSTPTDGSALAASDDRGVECEQCHLQVDPDQPTNVAGTTEEQNAPYEAFDPVTGDGYYGSGQSVFNSGGTRLGPYEEGDHQAKHQAMGSPFHRTGEFCGTCHDVSNPAVGDLAHNNGAQQPLPPGSFSGVLGSPVDGKAAFNNPPYAYGVVERTFSEWKASDYDTTLVNDYPTLPADLQDPDGILHFAYHQAWDDRGEANYENGTQRFFTCQTCHMSAATGYGCNKPNMPLRTDLPRHDLTGGGYYMPDVVAYQADHGMLRLGALSADWRSGMDSGKIRARARLQAAAALSAAQQGNDLVVRVTNLTGHKLISGYPEGRRMWLNVRFYDAGSNLIAEEGAYGQIGRTVDDKGGTPHAVESLLDPDVTVVFEAEMGMTQQWASQLLSLGYDPALALSYDRTTDAVEHTLGELAAESAGTAYHTFHFVLNNTMIHDGRIPPYRMSYNESVDRNIRPVPGNQFGDPGPGGFYDHFGDYAFPVPGGAASAEVNLYYQQTSWEYIQFLWLANDGQNAFLAEEGINMLDAWLNTGQGAPLLMNSVTAAVTGPIAAVPGEAGQLLASYNKTTGEIEIGYVAACDALDHNVYFGPLADVSTYGYSGVECSIGTSGSASFDPLLDDVFFLVVANDGSEEGSYGLRDIGGSLSQRPEDSATPVCDRPQNLAGVVCE